MSKQDSFRYTSLCRFFLAGRCERGEDCHFAHDESQLREKPNLYKTRICRSLQKSGQCKEGPGCRFAHGQDEVRDYSSGASAAESVEGDGWARTESSWSLEEEGDMKNGYAVPWVDQGMGYCPAMWPGYGFPVMGWMPSGEMAWIPCQWEEQETTKCEEHDADTVEPSADVTDPCTVEGILEWDPMNLSKPEGKDFTCDLSWDPLGLGVCSNSEGTAVACLDPSVVLLAARALDKKSSTVDAVKRASFYSLPSTEFSEKTEKDDETDSVFEAWAANREGGDNPDDIIMHKALGEIFREATQDDRPFAIADLAQLMSWLRCGRQRFQGSVALRVSEALIAWELPLHSRPTVKHRPVPKPTRNLPRPPDAGAFLGHRSVQWGWQAVRETRDAAVDALPALKGDVDELWPLIWLVPSLHRSLQLLGALHLPWMQKVWLLQHIRLLCDQLSLWLESPCCRGGKALEVTRAKRQESKPGR